MGIGGKISASVHFGSIIAFVMNSYFRERVAKGTHLGKKEIFFTYCLEIALEKKGCLHLPSNFLKVFVLRKKYFFFFLFSILGRKYG